MLQNLFPTHNVKARLQAKLGGTIRVVNTLFDYPAIDRLRCRIVVDTAVTSQWVVEIDRCHPTISVSHNHPFQVLQEVVAYA